MTITSSNLEARIHADDETRHTRPLTTETVIGTHLLPTTPLDESHVEQVLRELVAIKVEMVSTLALSEERLGQIHPNYRASAKNLLQYLTLRRRDLRPLQLRLAEMGLSSLGRAESHVQATVDAVLEVLRRLAQQPRPSSTTQATVPDFASGQRLLADHTEAVFGPAPPSVRRE